MDSLDSLRRVGEEAVLDMIDSLGRNKEESRDWEAARFGTDCVLWQELGVEEVEAFVHTWEVAGKDRAEELLGKYSSSG